MGRKKYSPEEVHYLDGGLFTLGTDELRVMVSWAFSRIPTEVVDRVMDECLMAMTLAKEQGAYIPKELFKGKPLILFSEVLLEKDQEEAQRIILHETAHFVLGHRSPVSGDVDYDAQEREAWALVDQWLEAH